MQKQRIFILEKKFYIHPVFSNYAASKDGEIVNIKTKRILKIQKNNSGYCQFSVYDKKLEKPKKYLQHRFVFESIKGVIPDGFVIDHRDNCKSDNRLENLQLLTPFENHNKSHNQSIISINVKTNEEKVYITIKTASNELKIDASNISKICNPKKCYKTATSKKDGNKYRFEFLNKV